MNDNANTDTSIPDQEQAQTPQAQAPQAQAQRPVTIEDVKAALGDTDPHKTNAAALRKLIGRGGGGNIQKLLDAIRLERMPKLVEGVAVSAPPVPKELIASMSNSWAQAWAEAQSRTSNALAEALQQKEFLASTLSLSNQDLATARDQVDELQNELQKITEQTESLEGKAEEAFDKLANEFEEYKKAAEKKLEDCKFVAEKEIGDLKHQLDLIQRDREIEKQTLQSTIDKLLDQVSEYKSLFKTLKTNQ